jgi:hypothetical protein
MRAEPMPARAVAQNHDVALVPRLAEPDVAPAVVIRPPPAPVAALHTTILPLGAPFRTLHAPIAIRTPLLRIPPLALIGLGEERRSHPQRGAE